MPKKKNNSNGNAKTTQASNSKTIPSNAKLEIKTTSKRTIDKGILYWEGAISSEDYEEEVQNTIQALLEGRLAEAGFERLRGVKGVYSARVTGKGRVLFTEQKRHGKNHLVILAHLPDHEYDKSGFIKLPNYLKKYLLKHREDINKAIDQLDFEQTELPFEIEKNVKITFKKVHYFGNSFVVLTAEQEKMCALAFPARILGAPGTGKTSTSAEILHSARTKGLKGPILYLTKSETLRDDVEKKCLEGNYNTKGDQFKTYKEFIQDALLKIHGPSFKIQWIGEGSFTKWLKEQYFPINKLFKELNKVNAHFLYHQLAIISTYDKNKSKDDYLKLTEEDGLSLELREKIWNMGVAYLKYLKDQNQKGFVDELLYFPDQFDDPFYSLILVDETQDLSPDAIECLIRSAKKTADDKPQILFSFGQHQSINDALAKGPWLQEYFAKQSIMLNTEYLTESQRCSKKIAKFASKVIQLKKNLQQGVAKDEFVEFHASADAEEGRVIYYDKRELEEAKRKKKELPIFEAASLSSFKIVTWPHLVEEAKKLYNTALVYTPDDIKGLESEGIIVHKMFSDPVVEESDPNAEKGFFKGANAELRKKSSIMEEGKRGKKSTSEYESELNKLFVMLSRAQNTMYIVEDKVHSNEYLVDFMKKDFAFDLDNERYKMSTKEEWEEEAKRLIEAKFHDKAIHVYVEKLNYPELEARKKVESIVTALTKIEEESIAPNDGKEEIIEPSKEEDNKDVRSEEENIFSKDRKVNINSHKKSKKEKNKKEKNKKDENKKDENKKAENKNAQLEKPSAHDTQQPLDEKKLIVTAGVFLSTLSNSFSIGEFYKMIDTIPNAIFSKPGLGKLSNEPLAMLLNRIIHKNLTVIVLEGLKELKKDLPSPVFKKIINLMGITILKLITQVKQKEPSSKLIKWMLEDDKDGKNATSLLHFYSEKNNTQVIEFLIDKGAKINHPHIDNGTALFIACENGNVEVAKLLIKNGADMYLAKNNLTPFLIACQKGHHQIIKLLIESKIKLTLSKEKMEFVRNAFQKGHIGLIAILMNMTIEKNSSDRALVLAQNIEGKDEEDVWKNFDFYSEDNLSFQIDEIIENKKAKNIELSDYYHELALTLLLKKIIYISQSSIVDDEKKLFFQIFEDFITMPTCTIDQIISLFELVINQNNTKGQDLLYDKKMVLLIKEQFGIETLIEFILSKTNLSDSNLEKLLLSLIELGLVDPMFNLDKLNRNNIDMDSLLVKHFEKEGPLKSGGFYLHLYKNFPDCPELISKFKKNHPLTNENHFVDILIPCLERYQPNYVIELINQGMPLYQKGSNECLLTEIFQIGINKDFLPSYKVIQALLSRPEIDFDQAEKALMKLMDMSPPCYRDDVLTLFILSGKVNEQILRKLMNIVLDKLFSFLDDNDEINALEWIESYVLIKHCLEENNLQQADLVKQLEKITGKNFTKDDLGQQLTPELRETWLSAKRRTSNQRQLFSACMNNDMKLFDQSIIASDININETNADGKTALYVASENANLKMVQSLINKGANINTKDNKGVGPLHLACQQDNHELVTYLIMNGADINSQDSNGMTPLHYACQEFNHEIAIELIDNGADSNILNHHGMSPFSIACQKGELLLVKLFLQKDAQLSDISQHSPANLAMNKLLLNLGITKLPPGFTELHEAICEGSKDVAFIILKYSTLPESSHKGLAPLEVAVFSKNTVMQTVLIVNNSKDAEKSLEFFSQLKPILINIRLTKKGLAFNEGDIIFKKIQDLLIPTYNALLLAKDEPRTILATLEEKLEELIKITAKARESEKTRSSTLYVSQDQEELHKVLVLQQSEVKKLISTGNFKVVTSQDKS